MRLTTRRASPVHSKVTRHSRGLVTQVLCSTILAFAFADIAPAQTAENWWTLNAERDLAEKGKLKELLTKKKVYVNVSFSDTRPNSPANSQEQNNVSRAVIEAVAAHKDLKKVTYPEEANLPCLCAPRLRKGPAIEVPTFPCCWMLMLRWPSRSLYWFPGANELTERGRRVSCGKPRVRMHSSKRLPRQGSPSTDFSGN